MESRSCASCLIRFDIEPCTVFAEKQVRRYRPLSIRYLIGLPNLPERRFLNRCMFCQTNRLKREGYTSFLVPLQKYVSCTASPPPVQKQAHPGLPPFLWLVMQRRWRRRHPPEHVLLRAPNAYSLQSNPATGLSCSVHCTKKGVSRRPCSFNYS